MNTLCIEDASSVSMRLADGLATVTVTLHFSLESHLLCCRKYNLTATATNSLFVSQQASCSMLHIRHGNSVRTRFFDGPAVVTMTSCVSISLAYSSAVNIRLLLHQQRINSFHNTQVQTPTQSNYLFHI
jgi:hypothetical protein